MNPALVISARDNVATALEVLEPGRTLQLGGHPVVVRDRIPSGHKIAIETIPAGQEVRKYGSPIGTAMSDLAAGAHVHTHNVASARGRGDLAVALAAARASEHPLAEPEG